MYFGNRHVISLAILLMSFGCMGCDVFLPYRIALCNSGLVPSAPAPTFAQDPNDLCLEVLTSDPADLPTYSQVLAEAECDALSFQGCNIFGGEAYVTGTCNDGQYLYISYSGGFGGPTHIFDAVTQRLVGITTTSDGIDPDCMGTFYKIAKIDCENRVVTRSLCPLGEFGPLFFR